MNLKEGSRIPDSEGQNLELIFGNGVPTMFYERGSGKGLLGNRGTSGD